MRVLIGCEFSGVVRRAFRARGHDAWSCDLLPAEDGPRWHIQDSVLTVLEAGWDLAIFHPPCTYLCNSGVRWLREQPGREELMHQASAFFLKCWNAPIGKVCVENPIPHRYAALPDYAQIVQPWQYGHGETKATCLWLRGLPALTPTNVVDGRAARVHLASPGPDRWKERSRTCPGIAEAMADQWGGVSSEQKGTHQ